MRIVERLWCHGSGGRNRYWRWARCKVRVLQCLSGSDTLRWVELKKPLQEIDGLRRCLGKDLLEGYFRIAGILLRLLLCRALALTYTCQQRTTRRYCGLTASLRIRRITRSSGVPIIRIIWRSWSWLSRPRNKGTPEIISAKMQPQDQTSIDVLYVREPNRTSGARYHRVTTCGSYEYLVCVSALRRVHTSLEKVFTGTPNALARPKSPSFSSPFRLIRRF